MVVLICTISHRVMDRPCVIIARPPRAPLILARVVPDNGCVPVISTLDMTMTKFLSYCWKPHLLNEHMLDFRDKPGSMKVRMV